MRGRLRGCEGSNMFRPENLYIVVPDKIHVKTFHEKKERYTIRPPYQRKSVWSLSKKQALLDSLFRKYYIPRIVLRDVKITEENYVSEVVDGQQRILTVQEFFSDEIKLPDSLGDFSQTYKIVGSVYSKLPEEIKNYLNDLYYDVDVIKGIDNPKDRKHQAIATKIFRRLQEGEPLNYMEKIHARIASISRNFITKYSDEIDFDYNLYRPIDDNPNRHKFFTLIERGNERMEHTALMARFLLLEIAGGVADCGQKEIEQLIEKYEREDGIGKFEFVEQPEKQASQELLKTLNLFYDILKDDITIDKDSGIKELSREYFIISMYLLLGHIRKCYVLDDEMKNKFKKFLEDFFQRWNADDESDELIVRFSEKRQQDNQSIETRDQIVRQEFFSFYSEAKLKDSRRIFNEAERIKIYRAHKGLCQVCLNNGCSPENAYVPWKQYEADHILAHSLGGNTDAWNGQVLCRPHNRAKSNK